MIQYYDGNNFTAGDADQVQAEVAQAAAVAAKKSADQAYQTGGLLVLGVAAYLYLQWRKKKKGGK
jgi:hypothetical protein